MKRNFAALEEALAGLALPSMNILRVAAAVQDGETITIGSTVFEIQALGGTVTAGRTAVNLTASPTAAKAAKVLTFAANPSAADTVTVGASVYTFRAALTAPTTAGEVLIGADLTESRDNLLAAINLGAGAGTLYGSATAANASAVAAAVSTNALSATALVAGTAGNSIAVAEAAAQLSWASGHTALSGGVDPTAVEAIDAIVIAINSVNAGFRASELATEEILLVQNQGLNVATAMTETLAGSGNGFAAAAAFGGEDAQVNAFPICRIVQRAAVALEVTLGLMRFPLNFTPTNVFVSVRTAAGVFKAWDGAAAITTGLVSVSNVGSSDWAATDVVTVIASR